MVKESKMELPVQTMVGNLLASITLAAALGSGLLTAPVRAAEPNSSEIQFEDLDPFTRGASIPADADPGTIRFVKVKTAKVRTKIKYETDANYCAEAVSRDPGGSLYCPRVQTESFATAYEVTYSFRGSAL